MFKRIHALVSLFVSGILIVVMVSACNSNTFTSNTSKKTNSTSTDNCRVIKHAMGETCVPQKFERLVTLDSTAFENAIALGIKSIATAFDNSSHLKDEFAQVKNIGELGQPNLESTVLLKPDLILGYDAQQSIYSQLSQISPTVLFNYEHGGQWKEMFKKLSTALGREKAAKQVMDKYYRRLEDFKQKMGNNPAKIKVSVVRVYPDSINLYLRDSFCGIVLQDAGLSRPESQDIGISAAKKLYGNENQASISNELIEKADGDVIFIWTYGHTPQIDKKAKKKLEELQSNPLWQSLKAVQENKVYLVPDYWIGSGILAANAIVDDLFKYLVK
ncbi:MAG: iron-siderophore ABC transporter substrate-binding protein [Cyanobacteriota bacterium]|nr:iron-siderophore ABC transporter substrate-binding protein [Cyanobacteriota bacterium]